jgi:uncharacterized protein (DUF1499 family)
MKNMFKRALFGLLIALVIGGTLTLVEYLGGQPMGLFSGSRPRDLGFSAGKFKPVSWKPNAVSSTVDAGDSKHYIAPFAYRGDKADAWKKLVALVKSQPRVNMVSETSGYLHAEFKSAGMGFVDDVEFAIDARGSSIHVRSASRLGIRDFNINRDRVEALRSAFSD